MHPARGLACLHRGAEHRQEPDQARNLRTRRDGKVLHGAWGPKPRKTYALTTWEHHTRLPLHARHGKRHALPAKLRCLAESRETLPALAGWEPEGSRAGVKGRSIRVE